ncbi:MAG: ADP-ribosylation factor-like protein [Promethearchaeota archaeon]|jgi:GTPase SAR1 family protein
MVRYTADHKVYIKILYWGMAGSGKTTMVDTLYRFTKENEKDIAPTGNLTKISMASGSTLYFDRGIFVSTKQTKSRGKVFYHVYTVAGQRRFSPLRKKIFKGTDGVIFTVDSQTHFFEDNIESLKELKNITRGKLIREIPLIIMLNKQDLTEVIGEEDFKQVLKDEKLWYEPDDELYNWNPIIYNTCALYEKRSNVYRSFSECARRTGLYQIYGDGEAPIGDNYKDSRDI